MTKQRTSDSTALVLSPNRLPSKESVFESSWLSRSLARRAVTVAFERMVGVVGVIGGAHPGARPELYDIEVEKNVPYLTDGDPAHMMDVYKPTTFSGPWPIALYVHGGSFRMLSKDSHWMMAVALARRGYLVFNINYRLAPAHPFPAALMDVGAAYLYLLKNAERFGGDLSRIVLAGESAGANLVTALTLETTYRRPEAFAREVFEANRVPDAVMPACGILQVSDAERFGRVSPLPGVIEDRILDCRDGYLAGHEASEKESLELADPLLLLEKGQTPDRPLPPFFAPVGDLDPLVPDTLRLKVALQTLGVTVEAPVFENEGHAFHMMPWKASAKALWSQAIAFFNRHAPRTQASWERHFAPLRSVRSNKVKDRIIATMAA